jgi:hypothetical protein
VRSLGELRVARTVVVGADGFGTAGLVNQPAYVSSRPATARAPKKMRARVVAVGERMVASTPDRGVVGLPEGTNAKSNVAARRH